MFFESPIEPIGPFRSNLKFEQYSTRHDDVKIVALRVGVCLRMVFKLKAASSLNVLGNVGPKL